MPCIEPSQQVPTSLLACTPAGWLALINHLTLKGVEKTLAMHCSVGRVEHNALFLTLDESYNMLLNTTNQKRIEVAVSDYFDSIIKVSIESGAIHHETAMMQIERLKQEQHSAAKEILAQDINVQAMMSILGAKFDEKSIIYGSVSQDASP